MVRPEFPSNDLVLLVIRNSLELGLRYVSIPHPICHLFQQLVMMDALQKFMKPQLVAWAKRYFRDYS
jgi:hypothetical protein